MYIQISKSKVKDKVYTCKMVRESYRTPAGPRSRNICNISKLPKHMQDTIEYLVKNPNKHLVPAESLGLHQAFDFGGIAVLHDAWERFNLDMVLSDVSDPVVQGRIKAMVFSRLLFPGSKLSLKMSSASSALAASCGLAQNDLDEDRLYEAMDALSGKWSRIEKNLYSEAFPDQVTFVLYDLTSSYFASAKNKKNAAYGYSRDHRRDRTQIILALATNSDGIPIHIEVLKGNRSDNKTLLPLLETMKRRFGISRAVFSFDGGMSSSFNLQQMRDDEIDYVTRMSSSTLQALVPQLPVENQPEIWDRTDLAEFEIDGVRYVVAGSEYRRQRDWERREARLMKGRQELEKFNEVNRKKIDVPKLTSQVGRMLERKKCLKYFDFRIEDNGKASWTEKHEDIEKEKRLDGWYLLTTSLPAETAGKKDIFNHYRNLLAVEDAFRETKSYLKVRPIFHQKDNRVRNHIRICFLSYWMSSRLRLEWQQKGEKREVPLILKELQQIRMGKLKLGIEILKTVITDKPSRLNSLLHNLSLLELFQQVPKWVL